MSEVAAPEIAAVLGIPPEGADRPFSVISLIACIEAGLPVAALDRISNSYAPADKSFVFRVLPRATLDRRRRTHRLTPSEGGLVARLARIWSAAIDTWKDDEAARSFLFRPHPLIEGRTPVDVVLASEFGAGLVEDILGRLKYGTAA